MKPVLSTVAGLAALLVTGSCSNEILRPAYWASDEPFVQRALNFYSGNGRMPAEELARVYPVAVHFPGVTCIGLWPKRAGWPDGGTMCFADATGKKLSYYEEGRKPTGKAEMPINCPTNSSTPPDPPS